jgi:hypothetical protein
VGLILLSSTISHANILSESPSGKLSRFIADVSKTEYEVKELDCAEPKIQSVFHYIVPQAYYAKSTCIQKSSNEHPSSTANNSNSTPPVRLFNRSLISYRLRRDAIHDQVLSPMQPLSRLLFHLFHFAVLSILEQIRGTEHWPACQVSRIDSDDECILAVLVRKVLRDTLCVTECVVDTDEGRRDVGLLVQVCDTEAR